MMSAKDRRLSDRLDGARQPVPDQRIDAEALAALHREFNGLPSKCRLPIVSVPGGKESEEAARALRSPVGTLLGGCREAVLSSGSGLNVRA